MTDPANPPQKGVIPYLNVVGAADAVDLYQRAFGAVEVRRMPSEDAYA
jgi:PhnB protein